MPFRRTPDRRTYDGKENHMGRTFDETRAKAAVDDATRQAEHHIDDEPGPTCAAHDPDPLAAA